MRIVIGGMVASGKSTVAKLLSEKTGIPYLEEFDTTEPSNSQFLELLRWQSEGLNLGKETFQFYTFFQSVQRQMNMNRPYIMDRDIIEHLIFAKRSLGNTVEFAAYLMMWNHYMNQLSDIAMYVVLTTNKETFLERLLARDRSQEKSSFDSLLKLHDDYDKELVQMLSTNDIPYLIIDTVGKTPNDIVDIILEELRIM